MGALSFKSVGRKLQSFQEESVDRTKKLIPIGIKTPLEITNEEGPFKMHFDLVELIADNLKNLLLTNWGERLGQYDFGANLKPLTVNFSSQDSFDDEALARISRAISTWMPFVEPVNFVSEVDRSQKLNTALIKINISYNIPTLQVTDRGIQIVLYVI